MKFSSQETYMYKHYTYMYKQKHIFCYIV